MLVSFSSEEKLSKRHIRATVFSEIFSVNIDVPKFSNYPIMLLNIPDGSIADKCDD